MTHRGYTPVDHFHGDCIRGVLLVGAEAVQLLHSLVEANRECLDLLIAIGQMICKRRSLLHSTAASTQLLACGLNKSQITILPTVQLWGLNRCSEEEQNGTSHES